MARTEQPDSIASIGRAEHGSKERTVEKGQQGQDFTGQLRQDSWDRVVVTRQKIQNDQNMPARTIEMGHKSCGRTAGQCCRTAQPG